MGSAARHLTIAKVARGRPAVRGRLLQLLGRALEEPGRRL